MKAFLIAMFTGLIAVVQGYPLYKSKAYRDLIVFLVLLGVSSGLALLLAMGIKIPSPSKVIEVLVKSVIRTKLE